MGVVNSSGNHLVCRPVKGALTFGAEHLVASIVFLNVYLALGTLLDFFFLNGKKFDCIDNVLVAYMS